MEKMDLILIILFSIFAVIGLMIVALQKKGSVKARLLQTSNAFTFVGGGKLTLLCALFGAFMIYQYSAIFAVLYFLIIGIIYIAIKLV